MTLGRFARLELFTVGKILQVDIRCVREQVAEGLMLTTCAPEIPIEASIHKFTVRSLSNEKSSIIVLRTFDKPAPVRIESIALPPPLRWRWRCGASTTTASGFREYRYA